MVKAATFVPGEEFKNLASTRGALTVTPGTAMRASAVESVAEEYAIPAYPGPAA